MTVASIGVLVCLASSAPHGGTLGPADVVSPDEVTLEWIRQVFEQAFIGAEIDEDGDLELHESGGRIGWLSLDRDRKIINLFTIGTFRSEASRAARLEFVNDLNTNVLGATFYVTADSLLVADWYIFFEAGISDRQLVNQYQRFRDALQSAIGRDTDDILN